MPHGKGVPVNKTRIGILDFIRSLEDDDFPYDDNSSLMIVGIEDVLLAARPDMEETAKEIRASLNGCAKLFDSRNCADIQIVFKQPLVRGDKLMVDHVTAQIPIFLIFGTPVPDTINGQVVYRTGSFNLTGAGN